MPRTRHADGDHSRATGVAPIIARDIPGMSLQVTESINETEDFDKKKTTKQDHRNRIKDMYLWWQENSPEYVNAGGIVTLSDNQRNDPRFFAHKNTHDLTYDGLNVEYVKAFLSTKKKKPNGNLMSRVHIRKYHDAILFGAEKAKQHLPAEYYSEIKKFLNSYTKETVQAKKRGELDEDESDPIPWPLLRLICKWSLMSNNVFLWVFSIMQWNCIARSINIDNLGFHNLGKGMDSVTVTYNDSKMDKEGTKVSPKNCYANPLDPWVSFHLALGCYLCINQGSYTNTDKLFLKPYSSEGAAASRYCKGLASLLKEHISTVRTYMDPKKARSHGIWKGGAREITTNTTQPAPIPSVAARGEWSIGQVLDLYWQFGDSGDCFAGRSIAGLDPDDARFGILPPHFPVGPENEHIQEALNLCFGTILKKHPDMMSKLLLFLASMVYASDFLYTITATVPNHSFSTIPILRRVDLLTELKKLVTIEPTDNMPHPTGVPPQVKQLVLLRDLLHTCQVVLVKINNLQVTLRQDIKTAIAEAFEEQAIGNGHVTASTMEKIMDDRFGIFETAIVGKLSTVLASYGGPNAPETHTNNQLMSETTNFKLGELYTYEGRFWHVPNDFLFPVKATRKSGWDLWLRGNPGHKSVINGKLVATPIPPFRRFDAKMLPSKIRNAYKSSWRPVFQMMEEAPGIEIPPDTSKMTSIDIDKLFDAGTNHLKLLASYIWSGRMKHDGWSPSTWSTRLRRSAIEKKGTENDQKQLPLPTTFNRPKNDNRKKRRQCVHPGFQTQAAAEAATYFVSRTCGNPSIPVCELSDYARARGEQIEAEVNAEMELENEATEGRVARGVPAVGGGTLYNIPVCELSDYARARGEQIEAEVNAEMELENEATEGRVARGVPAVGGGTLYVGRPRDLVRDECPRRGLVSDELFQERLELMVEPIGKRTGPCAVTECTNPNFELNHQCHYHGCNNYVHSLCCQAASLCDNMNEVYLYCSEVCKDNLDN